MEAAREGRWVLLERAHDRLQQLLAAAVAARAADDVEMIESALGNAQKAITYLHDVPPEPGPAAHAWMLRATASVAGMAMREMPSRKAVLNDLEGDVRDRILCALLEAQGGKLWNAELADVVGADPSTVARILPNLRAERLVDFTQVGKKKLNWLTAAGRRVASRLREVARRGAGQLDPPGDVLDRIEASMDGFAATLKSKQDNGWVRTAPRLGR